MKNTQPRNSNGAEMGRLIEGVSDALTDSMIERLSTTGANTLDIVDRLNDDETREAVHGAIDKLTELHRTGALDTVFELLTLLHGARQASSDSIIERLFVFIEQLLTIADNSELSELLQNAQISLDEAARETEKADPKGGLLALLSIMSKPETQRSLHFLMGFSAKFQKNSVE